MYGLELPSGVFMPLVFRPCRAEDVEAIIPLMYSSGPDAFRYVFSVDSELQALDFLRASFVRGSGEFGYKDHVVAIDDGEIIALVGMWHSRENASYMLSAIKNIFGFFGLIKGTRVITRGIRFERIVRPPGKGALCLHNLGVSEQVRGKGYGQQLIAWFLEQAEKQNVAAVGLDVAETNPRAKALYERLGFEVKEFRPGKLKNKFGRGVSHEYMEYSLR